METVAGDTSPGTAVVVERRLRGRVRQVGGRARVGGRQDSAKDGDGPGRRKSADTEESKGEDSDLKESSLREGQKPTATGTARSSPSDSPAEVPENEGRQDRSSEADSLKLCAFCNCGEEGYLGQGDLTHCSPTLGYTHSFRKPSPSGKRDAEGARAGNGGSLLPHTSKRESKQSFRSNQLHDTTSVSEKTTSDGGSSSHVWDELSHVGLPESVNPRTLFDPTGYCWAHHCCAAWSEGVCMAEDESLLNVDKAVICGLSQRCSYCHRLGATIKCVQENCRRFYHYPCAAGAGAFQDIQSLTLFCPDHLNQASDLVGEEAECAVCDSAGDVSNQLFCTSCGQHYHGACLEIEPSPVRRAGWQCPECKICQTCKEAGDDNKMLVCDTCDKGYHTFCLQPPLKDVPKNIWKCKNCCICQDCGSRSPGPSPSACWHHDFSLCELCLQTRARRAPCLLCNLTTLPDGKSSKLLCQGCQRWVHAECSKSEFGLEEDFMCRQCLQLNVSQVDSGDVEQDEQMDAELVAESPHHSLDDQKAMPNNEELGVEEEVVCHQEADELEVATSNMSLECSPAEPHLQQEQKVEDFMQRVEEDEGCEEVTHNTNMDKESPRTLETVEEVKELEKMDDDEEVEVEENVQQRMQEEVADEEHDVSMENERLVMVGNNNEQEESPVEDPQTEEEIVKTQEVIEKEKDSMHSGVEMKETRKDDAIDTVDLKQEEDVVEKNREIKNEDDSEGEAVGPNELSGDDEELDRAEDKTENQVAQSIKLPWSVDAVGSGSLSLDWMGSQDSNIVQTVSKSPEAMSESSLIPDVQKKEPLDKERETIEKFEGVFANTTKSAQEVEPNEEFEEADNRIMAADEIKLENDEMLESERAFVGRRNDSSMDMAQPLEMDSSDEGSGIAWHTHVSLARSPSENVQNNAESAMSKDEKHFKISPRSDVDSDMDDGMDTEEMSGADSGHNMPKGGSDGASHASLEMCSPQAESDTVLDSTDAGLVEEFLSSELFSSDASLDTCQAERFVHTATITPPTHGMGKPMMGKRRFSPGRPRVRTGRGGGFPGKRRPRGAGGGSRGGRGRSRLKTSNFIMMGIPMMDDPPVIDDEEENSMHNTLVLFSTDDKFTLLQDMCVVCGSFGHGAEGRLLACSQCGQCYHPYCVGVKITKVVLSKGWRCLECTVCEQCGKASDPGRLLLCDDCDISYHTYCLDPPLHTVPKGGWKCKWCVCCVRCGATSPGFKCEWQKNYTHCGLCASLSTCPNCMEEYQENELVIQCRQCDRWVHATCENLLLEDYVEEAADQGFDCSSCRPYVPPLPQATINPTPEKEVVLPQPCKVKDSEPPKVYSRDGVFLTEVGLSQLESQMAPAAPRKPRMRPKLRLKLPGQPDLVTELQSPIELRPQAAPRDGDAAAAESKDGDTMIAEYDGRSEAFTSPEREVAEENTPLSGKDNDGTKKRKRNPYRPGIGGFMVRQRGRGAATRGRGTCRRGSGGRVDTLPSPMHLESGKGGEVETPAEASIEGTTTAAEPAEKQKVRRWRRKKSALEDSFPTYLQEAFFGKSLLDTTRERRKNLDLILDDEHTESIEGSNAKMLASMDLGPSNNSTAADERKPQDQDVQQESNSSQLPNSATAGDLPTKNQNNASRPAEDPLADLSEVLTNAEFLGILSGGMEKPADASTSMDLPRLPDERMPGASQPPGSRLGPEPLLGSSELDRIVTDELAQIEPKDVADLFSVLNPPGGSHANPAAPGLSERTRGMPPMPLPPQFSAIPRPDMLPMMPQGPFPEFLR
uniref:Uncharacterized protein n=1 Tax=Eptatretus burgeri TaxID=7764 RepID=A0A8C4RAR0_EPTBU